MDSTCPRAPEAEWEAGVRQVNECEYLFVETIREIAELTLELVLTEAKPQATIVAARDDSAAEQLRIGGRPIEADGTCRIFRLIFERDKMVSYTVLNESYGRYPEPPEQFTGKLFRAFSWSHLLEFVKRTTIASDDYPGALHHYQIACLNHVVDVICAGPPTIEVSYGLSARVEEPL